MISVICWKWKPVIGYRTAFGPMAVNVLRRMVARCYPHPHRFICVTDDPVGLAKDVEVVPLWNDFEHLLNPCGARRPSCYRRLRAFHPDIASLFGERFVSIDLDVVLTGDVTPLWQRPEDFVIYGGTQRRTPYNGSMFLLRAGARPRVWHDFDPTTSPERTRGLGLYGSDQAWISYCLGPHEARWTPDDGVYSYRVHIAPRPPTVPAFGLPTNARIVVFNGAAKPWDVTLQGVHPWIKTHWR